MAPTLAAFGIDRLSVPERIALVQDIWDSIAAEQPAGSLLSDPQRAELDRRLAEDNAAPDDAIPWERAKAEILARLGQ
jgi:putative addiction module component (TIGR02574 family)